MSYKQGWDRWKLIENYLENGNDIMDKFNEFMKRQAELETEYSNGMHKLIKSCKDDIQRRGADKVFGNHNIAVQNTTINAAYKCLLDQMEKIAIIHSELANSLDCNLRKPVKYKSRDNMVFNKAIFDDIKKSALEVSKAYDITDKLRLRALKSFKDLDLSFIALNTDSGKKKDPEKLKLDFEKKLHVAVESEKAYEASIDDLNLKQDKHFKSLLLDKLGQVQKEDEQSRIIFMKNAVQKYNQLYLDAENKILEENHVMTVVFDNISASFDTDFFAKILNSHADPITNVKPFEVLDNDCERRRILNGDIKSLDKDDKEIEKVLSYDPREAKKRALAKVKIIESSIEAVSKAMASMKLMKEHVSANMISEITATGTGALLDSLEIKKHYLESIIAKSDGLPEPELPLYLKKSQTKPPEHKAIEDYTRDVDLDLQNSILEGFTKYDSPKKPSLQLRIPSTSSVDSLGISNYSNPPQCLAKVIYDFEAAQNTQEMTVLQGDILEIVEKSEDGWWRAIKQGTTGIIEEGYVPGNYLEIMDNTIST